MRAQSAPCKQPQPCCPGTHDTNPLLICLPGGKLCSRLRGCQLKAGARLLDPSLASSLLAFWTLVYICSQGSGCPQNNHRASVNLSLLYGKPARNYSLQLPTHTTPCFFTDTYPLTKITIKKPPREMYFWEPVLLTCCHCETYIINKSYAMAVFFLLLYILSEAASYLRKQVFCKTDTNCEVEDCRLMPFS